MKRILCMFLILALMLPMASCKVLKREPTVEEQIKEVLAGMTLEEKVGQLFVFSIPGTELTDNVVSFLDKTKAGNVILYNDNIVDRQQTFDLNKALQKEIIANTAAPAFIAIDQEGGVVNRVSDGATVFTSAMGLAATNKIDNAQTVGLYMGEELRNLGFNMNFAPCVDLNANPINPVIGTRSYGDDYKKVVDFATGMVIGIQDRQVLTCVKHYPGHGSTSEDTHNGLVTVNKTIEELKASDLIPFEWAIKNGVHGVMTAHIVYPNVHDTKEPATMSEYFLKDLLRKEYGFEGLIVTDSVSMGAITNNYSMSDAAVAALNNGADMVVMGGAGTTNATLNDQLLAFDAVLSGIKDGSVSHADIYDKVFRVLYYKHYYGLFEYVKDSYKWMSEPPAYNEKEHEAFADTIAAESVTLVRGELKVTPDDLANTLIVSDKATLKVKNTKTTAADYLAQLTGAQAITYNTNDKDFNRNEILQAVRGADKVLILSRSAFFDKDDAAFINSLTRAKGGCTVISIGSPYDSRVLNCSNYLCAYSGVPSAIRGIAKVLKGEMEITGVLPVNLDAEITITETVVPEETQEAEEPQEAEETNTEE